MATLVIKFKTEMPRAALELMAPSIEEMFKKQGQNMGVKPKNVKLSIEE